MKQRPRNIALVLSGRHFGGAEMYARAWCKALQRSGAGITLYHPDDLAFDPSRIGASDNCPYHLPHEIESFHRFRLRESSIQLLRSPGSVFMTMAGLFQQLVAKSHDLVISFGMKAHFLLGLSKPPGVHWVVVINDLLTHKILKESFRTLLLLRPPRGIVAPSRAAFRWYRIASTPSKRLLLPLALQLDNSFPPAGRKSELCNSLKQKHGIPVSARMLLTVGHLSLFKGHSQFVRLLSDIRVDGEGRPVHGVIVGGEYVSQSGVRDELVDTAAQLGCAERLHLPGEQSDVSMWYHCADLVLQLSDFEIFGLAALEAMACGCPVVAWDVPGLNEIVHDDRNGFLVDKGNIGRVQQCVELLLNHNRLRENLSKNAKQFALVVGSVDRFERDVKRFFSRIYSG